MIKYNLSCDRKHEFESWFSDSFEFEKLKKKRLLECIYCSSKKIEKTIMAPMVSTSNQNNKKFKKLDKIFRKEKNALINLRNYIEKNYEFVGDKFSKRVREIYYDKDSKKTIYGTATKEERKELEEEGINLISVPWVNKDN